MEYYFKLCGSDIAVKICNYNNYFYFSLFCVSHRFATKIVGLVVAGLYLKLNWAKIQGEQSENGMFLLDTKPHLTPVQYLDFILKNLLSSTETAASVSLETF